MKTKKLELDLVALIAAQAFLIFNIVYLVVNI